MTDALDLILARREKVAGYVVGIDITLDLERVLVTTPPAIQEAAELVAEADYLRNQAKDAVDVAEAEAGLRIREALSGVRDPPQNRIDAQIPLDPEVKKAKEMLNAAIRAVKLCESSFRGLDSQSRTLGKTADMLVSGFWSPQVLHDRARSEFRRARAEADRKDKAER